MKNIEHKIEKCRRKTDKPLTFRAREYDGCLNKCNLCEGYNTNCGDYKVE